MEAVNGWTEVNIHLLTEYKVKAIADCDVGQEAVEAVLDSLERVRYYPFVRRKSTLLTWGFVSIEKGRVPLKDKVYLPPLPDRYFGCLKHNDTVNVALDNDKGTYCPCSVWLVLEIPFDSLRISSEVPGHPEFMYIAYNVGLEGWTVITTDFHILTHVLKKNNISTRYLSIQRPCNESCKRHCYDLVPRVIPVRTPMYYSVM